LAHQAATAELHARDRFGRRAGPMSLRFRDQALVGYGRGRRADEKTPVRRQ
jgi:hypothetical protein